MSIITVQSNSYCKVKGWQVKRDEGSLLFKTRISLNSYSRIAAEKLNGNSHQHDAEHFTDDADTGLA